MREIELASWDNVNRRVASIVKSLEIIYDAKLHVVRRDIPLERVHPTEDFLENDKLALVFMKIVREDYNVPIVVVERDEDYFVLDGHHRAFIRKKLMNEKIDANVLIFLEGRRYREILKQPLETLRMKDVSPIKDPILKAWQRILFVAEHYEAIYSTPFCLCREQVMLKDLVPTESHIERGQIDSIRKLLVPIVCVRDEDRCYILDGHARSLRAKELGLSSIEAMILQPCKKIDFGIVKTAASMNLQNLEDVEIVDKLS